MPVTAFAVRPSVCRAIGVGRRAGRTSCAAAVAVALGFVGLIVCAMPQLAIAQEAGGPIVIPGPAEKNPAALAELANRVASTAPDARNSTPAIAAAMSMSGATAPASSRTDDRFTQAANANGAIVIPGPGDAVVAPAIRRANFNPATANQSAIDTPRMMRVNVPASREVIPVIVTSTQTPPQPAVRQTAPVAFNPPRAPVAIVRASTSTAAATAQPGGPTAAPAQEDGETIRSAALAYLQQQSAGLPGKIEITVAPVFPRGLAACTTLAPFMPTGMRLWGRTTVGVRCAGERPWTLYLQAKIAIHATYYLAARALAPGDVLSAADLVARDGDLTSLPMAVVTDPSQAVGAAALTRVAAGLPLRQDMLRSASSVTIGQTVRVVAQGQGFAISAEGSAMNNAAPGQQVRVKTAGGQIISGIVKDGSTVEIQL
ncbi:MULTISPECIES: flagellar basal body P-ring formation chaperone FlgA [Paraburkholderia]|uniref:flagellar basal body P-ring formation chaperone FlgA n=1 Tax=Paraburkholderia TaxID=1822464 RepID=UPI00224D43C5|nr:MULTISPECIES: flagellar basal body P-ring formation chaperone FlgA [Paraburkholderia]MCX4164766.1 flagellar basal body P-ring formation chaperone FlgA [Paraburkholderia megapolitana]MDN7160259.1 flagellar basal body P-ring formation protein FlgA [Paraburkholderia sp. CHISQ3]MDQ6497306.1 flagellar basal body P-ring formation chaperone FlgA [Paraburkholderia megapolitana]